MGKIPIDDLIKKYNPQWLVFNYMDGDYLEETEKWILEALIKFELADTKHLIFLSASIFQLEVILKHIIKYRIQITPTMGYYQVQLTKLDVLDRP